MSKQVAACPYCDSSDITRRTTTDKYKLRNHRMNYRCGRCLETFNEPEERPAKTPDNMDKAGVDPTDPNTGLAAKLHEMDAEEI